jgi:hypothetical protein
VVEIPLTPTKARTEAPIKEQQATSHLSGTVELLNNVFVKAFVKNS